MSNIDRTQLEIERAIRGDITSFDAADNINTWYAEDIKDNKDYSEQAEEDEDNRQTELIYTSFTTGVPDLFSDEMRELFWNA